jgi:uncharacterized membrane-anchored protein
MTERLLVAFGALLVLLAVNVSIYGKESVKRDGEVVYIDLAPRDPRSLMQGDYMRLNFQLTRDIESSFRGQSEDRPREGETRVAPIMLDERHVARLAKPGESSVLGIRYRLRNGGVWLGTNAFFFEEGQDQRYAGARYGEFRVDRKSGEAVLVGLRDRSMKPLQEAP